VVIARRLRCLLLVVVVFVAAACQVDVALEVEMSADGSGTVTVEVRLDAEAAARVPDLATELQTADLTDAGWVVTGPDTEDEGAVTISVSKPFANPAEGTLVLAEVAGPDSPFSDLTLATSHPFGRTTSTFSGSVEFTDGVKGFAEAELTTLLNGQPFGGNLDLLEVETGLTAEEQTSFTVDVVIPGASRSWEIDPADPAPQTLSLSGTELRPVPLALVGLAALSLIALVVVVLIRLIRRRRRRPFADEPMEAPKPLDVDPLQEEPLVAVPPAAAGASEPPKQRKLELVALDTMGVVFSAGDDLAGRLADFVAANEGTTDRVLVAERYTEAVEGRLPVGRLWAELGVDGDPGDLSDDFLAVHHLTPGIRDFLERMRDRELLVACLADDIGEWARKLRVTHRLEPLTTVWLAAGDVGERLPGPALFERLRSTSGVEWANTLFIGTDEAALAAARSHGLAAAWFVPEGDDAPEDPSFPVIGSLADLGLG
jgi:FMN phosphatase YigB (HAD superfamily)